MKIQHLKDYQWAALAKTYKIDFNSENLNIKNVFDDISNNIYPNKKIEYVQPNFNFNQNLIIRPLVFNFEDTVYIKLAKIG